MTKLFNLWKLLGPGLLYAGAAVGVSHLVQSTKAGSLFGLELIGVIIVINIIKYPFFEFGPRYAAATGKSLLQGYEDLGKWSVKLYFALSILTMFTIQAAVTLVTASIISSLFDFNISINTWCFLLLATCFIIIIIGKYAVLDQLMKVIILLLTLSTITAVLFAFQNTTYFSLVNPPHFNFEESHIIFLIALIGWMPAPFDITVWHSLWTVEKNKGKGSQQILKASLTDFHVGYWGTTLLAICFVLLGAFSMYGTGTVFSEKGTVFAQQVIEMYTINIGVWSKPIISFAALTTMFSTTLTCFDAFPRQLPPTIKIIWPKTIQLKNTTLGIICLTVVGGGALIILNAFISNMATMITIATVSAFIIAPVLAYLSYRVVTGEHIPEFAKPSKALKRFSQFGLIVLSLFTILFILFKLSVL